MKKIIISLSIIICISLQIIGCTQQTADKNINKNQKIEATGEKTENDIREIAYQSLDENSKKSVGSWKGAKVEEYKSTTDYSVYTKEGSENIKGKDIYKVTFKTSDVNLGPITIYVDRYSYNVLGFDYRL